MGGSTNRCALCRVAFGQLFELQRHYLLVPALPTWGHRVLPVNGADVNGSNFTASQVVLPTVTITAPDADASEAASNNGSFTVTRSGSSTVGSLTVFYSTSGGATPGADYVTLSGSVTIPAGSASASITVTALDDSEVECPETVIATLTPNSAYVIGVPSAATVTITDNVRTKQK